MLVIVSDLHFTDGSTSNKKNGRDLFNVHPDAFRLLFQTVSGIIKRRRAKGCQAIQEVVFVYNGDIFDPLRTYEWFEDAEAIRRPWDAPFQEDVFGWNPGKSGALDTDFGYQTNWRELPRKMHAVFVAA